MADEAQIVNRIVVQGIDEAKAQVQSLKQLLNEAKAGYEQARRSANEQGLFQGATQGADELKRIINEIQLQIKRLNTEISQGDFSAREKVLNEELKIRQRISQQAEQQSARELADQQRLIEQMASGRERAMTQAASRESQMNTAQVARINSAAEQERTTREKAIEYESSVRQRLAQQEQSLADQMANYRETSAIRTATREEQMNAAQVARINSAAEQEMQARQKVLDYESTVRQRLAQQAAKQSVIDSIGGVGSQASYAKQMSTLSANIEESYRAFQRGAIGSTEYTAALDKYTKGMSVAKAEQEAFSKSIGTYTGQWERMRARVESHATWIMAGGLIGAAIAIPGAALDSIVRMDNAMASMNQVMDHTNTAANAASKGISEQAEQQNMLNSESQKFLTIAAQYGESVDNIIEAGKLWGKIYICSAA